MAKILAVEDSEKTQKLIQQSLLEAGHDVLTATDFFAASEILDVHHFDLLILDINLPFKDGFSCLQSIRKIRRFQELSVLFLSARADAKDVQRAIGLGAAGYLVKPFKPDQLRTKVGELLKKDEMKVVHVRTAVPQTPKAMGRAIYGTGVKLLSLSEVGVEVELDFSPPEGSSISINVPFFTDIDVTHSKFQVVRQDALKNGNFQCYLTYTGLSKDDLRRIQLWIESQVGAA